MCKGPSDTPANIKKCMESATDLMLQAMYEDWQRYSTPNAIKMTACLKEVLTDRGIL